MSKKPHCMRTSTHRCSYVTELRSWISVFLYRSFAEGISKTNILSASYEVCCASGWGSPEQPFFNVSLAKTQTQIRGGEHKKQSLLYCSEGKGATSWLPGRELPWQMRRTTSLNQLTEPENTTISGLFAHRLHPSHGRKKRWGIRRVPYYYGTVPFSLEGRQFANKPLACEGEKGHFPLVLCTLNKKHGERVFEEILKKSYNQGTSRNLQGGPKVVMRSGNQTCLMYSCVPFCIFKYMARRNHSHKTSLTSLCSRDHKSCLK